ncbi:MAG: glucosaminidase domain-containing protein [Roseateles sp.]|uniref:glucosaminidase domain-containing protein n=1 Tax=Roseateles sp. TaxID=1971397 RepID=UPI0039EA0408
MLNPEFRIGAAGGFAALPDAPRANGAGGAGGSFGALYRELNAEVSRFIAQGDDAGGGLSPEAQVHRLQAGAVDAPSAEQQAWLARIAPLAEEAGRALGVAPEVLSAHAALESGWGQRPIRTEAGADSHNLFGLKATAAWRGDVAEVQTTEYEDGVAQPRRAGFRSYADAGSAFRDFAQLIGGSPRYQGALGTGGDALAYGRALQQGGYATDPAYADKLARVAAQIAKGKR